MMETLILQGFKGSKNVFGTPPSLHGDILKLKNMKVILVKHIRKYFASRVSDSRLTLDVLSGDGGEVL